jgi:hypothetical protein
MLFVSGRFSGMLIFSRKAEAAPGLLLLVGESMALSGEGAEGR